jgi:hypothetical protein
LKETGPGFDLQKCMEYLIEEFKKTEGGYGHNIDKMTSEELDELMTYLVPAFTTHQVVSSGWFGSKKTIDIKQLKKVGPSIIHMVQNMYISKNTSQKINISPPPSLVPLPVPTISPMFVVMQPSPR